MTKIVKVLMFVLVIVGLLISMVSPALAAAPASVPNPDCTFTPMNSTVQMGTEVDFHIVNPDVSTSYMWEWHDGNKASTGTTASNAWYTTGKAFVSVTASGLNGVTRCNSYFVVTPIQGSYGGGMYQPDDTATPIVTPTPVATTTPSATPSAPTVKTIDSFNSSGNDSKTSGQYSPIINGNDNKVIVKIEQAAQPTTVAQATQPTVALVCPTPSSDEQIVCSRGDLIITTPARKNPFVEILLAIANWIGRH